MPRSINRWSITVALAALTVGCSGSTHEARSAGDDDHAAAARVGDIVDVATEAGNFDTLVAAVKAADLVDTLKGEGPFTVFAPTDQAFAKLPDGAVADLLEPRNKDKLSSVLTYHVLRGRVMASDVAALESATTVQGSDLTISVDSNGVRVDGATVVSTDIRASNGVVHVIDSVVMPSQG